MPGKRSAASIRKFKATIAKKRAINNVSVGTGANKIPLLDPPKPIEATQDQAIDNVTKMSSHIPESPRIIRRTTELLFSDGSTQVDVHNYSTRGY